MNKKFCFSRTLLLFPSVFGFVFVVVCVVCFFCVVVCLSFCSFFAFFSFPSVDYTKERGLNGKRKTKSKQGGFKRSFVSCSRDWVSHTVCVWATQAWVHSLCWSLERWENFVLSLWGLLVGEKQMLCPSMFFSFCSRRCGEKRNVLVQRKWNRVKGCWCKCINVSFSPNESLGG